MHCLPASSPEERGGLSLKTLVSFERSYVPHLTGVLQLGWEGIVSRATGYLLEVQKVPYALFNSTDEIIQDETCGVKNGEEGMIDLSSFESCACVSAHQNILQILRVTERWSARIRSWQGAIHLTPLLQKVPISRGTNESGIVNFFREGKSPST
ncbi:hypothetical protein BDN72DRAFT_146756 [Pluteus cervinus]|uniref:Uncharacterized protein n=1 Tax=Pluteus cervinus TaxID=181527 RepID=A0ACD2ZXC1_9AGAR|nr:hypothetical protein BDN72DRAFT_146756 [Pluteus cervinus]